MVWIHTGPFTRYSSLEGNNPGAGEHPYLYIMAYPPDYDDLRNDNCDDNHVLATKARYSYGDTRKWTTFLSGSTKPMSIFNTFEMRILEADFIAEHNETRTKALQALKALNDESDFIVKDADGDAVLDDNGNKMLFVIFVGHPDQPYVIQYKQMLKGQETVLTGREMERLRLYLSGAYDGEDEEGGEDGEGEDGEESVEGGERGDDQQDDTRVTSMMRRKASAAARVPMDTDNRRVTRSMTQRKVSATAHVPMDTDNRRVTRSMTLRKTSAAARVPINTQLSTRLLSQRGASIFSATTEKEWATVDTGFE